MFFHKICHPCGEMTQYDKGEGFWEGPKKNDTAYEQPQ